MDEKKVNGSVILGYLKFIKKYWGSDGVEECGKKVGFEFNKIVEGRWYYEELSADVLKWIADTKGVENLEKCGAHTTKDLGALSYIVRFMDVKSVLKKAPESFRDAFNYGSLDVEIGDRRAIIKMKDTAVDDHACPAWLGCFKGVLEVTKTQGTVRETQCQLKGASHCEFLMEW